MLASCRNDPMRHLLRLCGCTAARAVGGLVAGLACACGGATDIAPATDGGSSPLNHTVGAADSGVIPILSAEDSGTATSGCSAASQLAYVLSTQNVIYSFDPPTKSFTPVATLDCDAGSMVPNSMAVDRQGNAWVDYVSLNGQGNVTGGAIFEVNLQVGNCTPTNVVLGPGWYQVGMGYSTASATDPTDTLYLAGDNDIQSCVLVGDATSAGLATVDTATGALTPVGSFSNGLGGQNAELTGTGDGRLFGFFDLAEVEIAQINKTTAATPIQNAIPGVQCPWAYAFSFWGGDFYLYTAAGQNINSSVTHYTSADGGIDTSYIPDVGFAIIGAGVSTCAPTTSILPR
jgi:hypothetical protein